MRESACPDDCVITLSAVDVSKTFKQGVQEGTEHAPLRGPCVEDQRSGCVVPYPYHLGAARQEVQDPVHS